MALFTLAPETNGRNSAPLIIGHRGASFDAPENTLASFRLAWEQGADGIEGDFQLTSDGRVVCIHDLETERLAGEKHVVADTPLDLLRRLDVGAWKDTKFRGERIPTLDEVLAIVPEGKKVFLELKAGGVAIVAPLLKSIAASGLRDEQIVVISFDADAIAECERRKPALRTQWLARYEKQENGQWRPSEETIVTMMRKSGADALGSMANREALDESLVRRLSAEDVREFGVWTVDDPELARFYIKVGAWSITTNRPAWLREQLGLLGDVKC